MVDEFGSEKCRRKKDRQRWSVTKFREKYGRKKKVRWEKREEVKK